MNGKVSILLYSISLIVLIVAFALIFSAVENNKKERLELSQVREAREEFIQNSTEERNAASSKLARERARVDELKIKLDELRADLSLKEEEFFGQKQKISEMESRIEARKEIILSATESESQINLEKQEAKAKVDALAAEVPQLENQLFEIQQQKERASSRITELANKLADYDSITKQLRMHFNNALRGIRQYTRDRPWIEVGEKLTASFHSTDLGSGTIAIPLGSAAGIQLGMLFSIKSDQSEICKIKITGVESQRSLGKIIPMHGSPQVLTKLKKIDLVNL